VHLTGQQWDLTEVQQRMQISDAFRRECVSIGAESGGDGQGRGARRRTGIAARAFFK